ncbi:hypothetical protein BCV70DRAFT_126622 [Testicularia cyperi]|uniref:Uncharacterized protein n=1 Tax=Testicularia cyperi TaxID=1882483 RepID=A0A317XN04_9BASI|nr:hypothetical protein BCV70DRAFT_126622 [Testicularia cyperi]
MKPSTSALLKIRPMPASALPTPLRLPASKATRPSPSTSASASSAGTKPTTVASHLESSILQSTDDALSANVRFQDHVNKKDLYWKVSKPQRDTLRKLLKEA